MIRDSIVIEPTLRLELTMDLGATGFCSSREAPPLLLELLSVLISGFPDCTGQERRRCIFQTRDKPSLALYENIHVLVRFEKYTSSAPRLTID